MSRASRQEAGHIGEFQRAQQQDEFRRALRAMLMQPLMSPKHEAFPAVRRQAEALRDWFARECGWPLHVDREGARLFKRPADLSDSTRGLPDYDRRRYVLLCLACVVLERSDAQVTLHELGKRVMEQAADPALAGDFTFTLRTSAERRELVVVCKTLLDQGVLERVMGEEDNFIRESSWQQSDALYDVHRRLLAGMLAAVRGPSTWPTDETPLDLEARMQTLVAEHRIDSEQGRRDALRHHLARRLLDDPVLYSETLEGDALAYFSNQRGAMASRLCEAAGLIAEQRAEGVALVDEAGQLTDLAMPAEGTVAHVTLLVAELLAQHLREAREPLTIAKADIAEFLGNAAERYGRYWRKSARAAGAEWELTEIALERLRRLCLIAIVPDGVRPLAAIARFSLGETELRQTPGSLLPAESGA